MESDINCFSIIYSKTRRKAGTEDQLLVQSRHRALYKTRFIEITWHVRSSDWYFQQQEEALYIFNNNIISFMGRFIWGR